MCEPAVVSTPSVQNRSLIAERHALEQAALAAAEPRVGGLGHGQRLLGRLGDEGVERRGGARSPRRAPGQLARPRSARPRSPSRAALSVRPVSSLIRPPSARRSSRHARLGALRRIVAGAVAVGHHVRRASGAVIGITERSGSTPSVSTSPSCSIQPRMLRQLAGEPLLLRLRAPRSGRARRCAPRWPCRATCATIRGSGSGGRRRPTRGVARGSYTP